jgi:hypothetical protein
VRGEPTRQEEAVVLRLAGIALARPWMIPHLLGAAWAMRRRRWYARPPFLPLPPRAYVDWRLETTYGDPHARPPADELERYLAWSTRLRRHMRRR